MDERTGRTTGVIERIYECELECEVIAGGQNPEDFECSFLAGPR